MVVEIKVPSVGESVTEAVLAQWFKKDGERVEKGEALFVIETDKVTLEVEAEASGVVTIGVKEGETVLIGAVVGTLDAAADGDEAAPADKPAEKAPVAEEKVEKKKTGQEKAESAKLEKTAPPPNSATVADKEKAVEPAPREKSLPADLHLSPAVRRLVRETGVDVGAVTGTGPGGRITKGDVLLHLEAREAQEAAPKAAAPVESQAGPPAEETSRKPMTPIRQRIAARLLEARQNTAMLTTFNDLDMSRVMEIRSRYKEAFKKKYDVALGFMSFFIKAAVEALKEISGNKRFHRRQGHCLPPLLPHRGGDRNRPRTGRAGDPPLPKTLSLARSKRPSSTTWTRSRRTSSIWPTSKAGPLPSPTAGCSDRF